MKNWKGYNLLDLFLILLGVIVVTFSGFYFHSPFYMIISTNLGLFYVFTQAKGKIATQFLGVIYFSFYIYICFTQKYYGEASVYLIFMLPIYIYGIVHWLANKDTKNNVVIVRSNISKKEWIVLIFASLVCMVLIYFILSLLKTENVILNTLSFMTVLPAVYLLARRCKWNQVAFLINDFIVPFLWLVLVIEGDLSFLPMVIYHIFQITYDLYGLVEWIKLEKQQKRVDIKN